MYDMHPMGYALLCVSELAPKSCSENDKVLSAPTTTTTTWGKVCHVPARLVSQTTASAQILAATHSVADEPFTAIQALLVSRQLQFLSGLSRRSRGAAAESGLNQRPAAADPVAVTSIHKLVSAARKAALGGILPRGEPGDESCNVKVST